MKKSDLFLDPLDQPPGSWVEFLTSILADGLFLRCLRSICICAGLIGGITTSALGIVEAILPATTQMASLSPR